jgi:hypothetical protein
MLRSAFSRKKSKKNPKFLIQIFKKQFKFFFFKYAYTLTHVIKGPPAKIFGV